MEETKTKNFIGSDCESTQRKVIRDTIVSTHIHVNTLEIFISYPNMTCVKRHNASPILTPESKSDYSTYWNLFDQLGRRRYRRINILPVL